MDAGIVQRRVKKPFIIDVINGDLLGQFFVQRNEIHQRHSAVPEHAQPPQ